MQASSSSPSYIVSSENAPLATLTRASAGQFVNQSIVQQLTRDGNIRRRVVNLLSKGDIAITQWMLSLTLCT